MTSLYEKDFCQWVEQTTHCPVNGDFAAIDVEHLVEELKDLGNSIKHYLESNLTILLAHLLKLIVQSDAPPSMKNNWYNSVKELQNSYTRILENYY